MLKKYYWVLFLLIYSCCSYASFWDDVAACFTDPCNCGDSDITESWNGSPIRTIKPNSICPPWNKRDGRETDNCLLQFEPPSIFAQYYLSHCAERTSESTYFNPKIRIRYQSCNAFACWQLSTTLNWDGECMMWPGAYALPLLRICARVAVPAVAPSDLNQDGTPDDPGYTKGVHLNDVGHEENDQKFYDDAGAEIIFNRPKLCAYSDPGLLNLVSATGIHIDPMDWNPVKQPLHKTNELSPITKVLLFLIDTAQGMTLSEMLSKLLGMMGDTEGVHVMQSIIKAIGKILDFSSLMLEVMKLALKEFGTLNRSVDDYKFGCVELPFGPMPPPYCPKLGQFIASPSTRAICDKKYSSGDLQNFFMQTSNQPCVVSKLSNNFVNNAVRISLDNLVPLCKKNEDTSKTDKCVALRAPSAFLSASVIHLGSAQRDNIKKCLNTSDTGPCVNTKIDFSCSVSNNGCEDGARIVYAQRIGKDYSTISDYYVDDIPDCGSAKATGKTTCQEIWGINIGEFIDVNLSFPTLQGQDANDLLPLKKDGIKLKDNLGNNRVFVASIVRNSMLDSSFSPSLSRTPKDICVLESGALVGCERRATDGYEILTYKCGWNGINCPNNSYYTPQFIASIRALSDASAVTSTIVTPLSVNGNPKPLVSQIESVVNLAGYDFASFVADIAVAPASLYNAMPFSGVNSMNSLTIYGKYKNNVKPYDLANGKVNNAAIYLKGLEYINGKYIHGGTSGCLQLKDQEKCVPSQSDGNCVKAQIIESDTVDCEVFNKISTNPNYPNFRICNGSETGRVLQNILDLGGGISVYKCDNSVTCYDNNRKNNVEVCRVSTDFNNRLDPSKLLGPVINSGQHFTVKNPGTNPSAPDYFGYNLKTEAVRDKTSQELGLCIPLDVPKCSAISVATSTTGNATWPETAIGDEASGTCKAGWIVNNSGKPLTRYCLSDAVNKKVAFENLPTDVGCVENKGIDFTYSINIPDNIPHSESYDTSTKVGKLTLGNGATNLQNTLRCATYEFNIADKNQLAYFDAGKNSYVDDYLVVKINDSIGYNTPDYAVDGLRYNVSTMQCAVGTDIGNCRLIAARLPADSSSKFNHESFNVYGNLRDQGGNISVDKKFSLIDKLKNGQNKISVCVGVVGGGAIKFYMEYKLK